MKKSAKQHENPLRYGQETIVNNVDLTPLRSRREDSIVGESDRMNRLPDDQLKIGSDRRGVDEGEDLGLSFTRHETGGYIAGRAEDSAQRSRRRERVAQETFYLGDAIYMLHDLHPAHTGRLIKTVRDCGENRIGDIRRNILISH